MTGKSLSAFCPHIPSQLEVDVHALLGVDLDLRIGEFVVILGPSGIGKSMLLNILGGLDAPNQWHRPLPGS